MRKFFGRRRYQIPEVHPAVQMRVSAALYQATRALRDEAASLHASNPTQASYAALAADELEALHAPWSTIVIDEDVDAALRAQLGIS